MHKRIIETSLSRLDAERASYFNDVVSRLEDDPRASNNANIVYTVLNDVVAELPVYLDKAEFIDLLVNFADSNYQRMRQVMFGPAFVRDPTTIRLVTGDFIHQVVALSLEKHNTDENNGLPTSVHKLTWPYRDTDLVDPEDDPEEWAEAMAKDEAWRSQHGEDRRRSGPARIDDVAFEKVREVDVTKKNTTTK